MKALCMILLALILSGCDADHKKRLDQLEKAATDAENVVTGLKFDMHGMPPGTARDSMALRLKTARAKADEARKAFKQAQVE